MVLYDKIEAGKRLEKVQQVLKLKSRPFALKADIDVSLMGKMEQGKKTISKTTLDALERVYGINGKWLLNGEGTMFIGTNVPREIHPSPDAMSAGTNEKLIRDPRDQELIDSLYDRIEELKKQIDLSRALAVLEKVGIKPESKIEKKQAADTSSHPAEEGHVKTSSNPGGPSDTFLGPGFHSDDEEPMIR